MKDRFILTPYFLDRPLPALSKIAGDDWTIIAPQLPDGDQQERISAIHQPLADAVAETVKAGHRPVSIAGDCCSAIGFVAGLQRAGIDASLIWFDAHGDFNTWETTPSGFLGGMPLAMIVGRGEMRMPDAVGLKPLAENNVILTDGRDLDPGEQTALEESSVMHIPDATDLVHHIPDGPLCIHLDPDIVRPEEAPAMAYPAVGGPSLAQMKTICRGLARTGRVSAVSMGTWDSEKDLDARSQSACMGLLHALLEG
jgi:arginase